MATRVSEPASVVPSRQRAQERAKQMARSQPSATPIAPPIKLSMKKVTVDTSSGVGADTPTMSAVVLTTAVLMMPTGGAVVVGRVADGASAGWPILTAVPLLARVTPDRSALRIRQR